MNTWSKDELSKIVQTDDLHISPFREDGETYGTPTWIWSVVVDDALYVRAYNGQNSRWYKAAMRQKAGRITAAGITKEVSFEPVNEAVNDRIDDAYRSKCKQQSWFWPWLFLDHHGIEIGSHAHLGHLLPNATCLMEIRDLNDGSVFVIEVEGCLQTLNARDFRWTVCSENPHSPLPTFRGATSSTSGMSVVF